MIHYCASRRLETKVIGINSLDIVIGLVGGFIAIISSILQSILGTFESFRLENTIIRYFYWTSPTKKMNELYEPEDEQQAKQALVKSVATRGKYWYNFHEYIFANFLVKCFCCTNNWDCHKKRREKLERHLSATAMLEHELDIINVIKT